MRTSFLEFDESGGQWDEDGEAAGAPDASLPAEKQASGLATASRLPWTTSRSAARDRCSSTKGAVSGSSLDGSLTCELDETEQR
jgi:hypothetical protein